MSAERKRGERRVETGQGQVVESCDAPGSPGSREAEQPARRAFVRRASLGMATLGVAPASWVAGGEARAASEKASAGEGHQPSATQVAGAPFSNYGVPVDERNDVIRWVSANQAVPGNGVSWSPLHALEGTITPNGLHFERHHNGVPQLQADRWSLRLDGLVDNPLRFDLNTLHRYRLHSLSCFIECGGNSNSLWHPTPVQAPAGYLHGLLSAAQWSGIALSTLIDEAGPKPAARWLIAEGGDGAGVTVSLPLAKAMDNTQLALYQNGEPLRREQGYPARLIVPGWEGITHVKWLRRLYLADRPAMTRFDTVSYTDLQANGQARRFSFVVDVKSVITAPSPGDTLIGRGAVEITGLAWSGAGQVSEVEISTDGGKRWQQATLDRQDGPHALTRFRFTWYWSHAPAILQSRARDSTGRTQPTRAVLLSAQGSNAYYHYYAINSWAIDGKGQVSHVYA